MLVTKLSTKHTYALPAAKINYGILNVKFSRAKLWSLLDIEIKLLSKTI